jgi:hypothetical protein
MLNESDRRQTMVKRVFWTFVVALAVAAPIPAQVMLCTGGQPSAGFSVSDGPIIAAQCTLDATTDGTVLVIASTGVNRVDTDHAHIRLRVGVDQPNGPGLVISERVHDVYGTAYLDRQTSMSTVAIPVVAGSHTLYYLAERVVGSASVVLYRPRVMAIFIPSNESNIRLCEGRVPGEFTTTSPSQTIVTSCSLANLGLGSALVAADAWMHFTDADVELSADLRVGDPPVGAPGSQRWLDVVGDLVYDGLDSVLATSSLADLGPGTASFYLTASRDAGSGTVSLRQPGVAALWAATGGPVLANGEALSTDWTTTSVAPQTILHTNLNPTVDGYFLILATASVSGHLADYLAHFVARVDLGDDIANRDVKISDYISRNLALSDLVPVEAGNHTIRLSGGRSDTPATTNLRVRDASLSVLFFPKEMVAVFADDFETGSDRRWSASVP